tara:strand:+ start:1373 stop:1657 length:285 start_codon:yes stop_codon:yes gene_type:complete
MARNLSYLQISQANLRSGFDFGWVLEDSWNTSRWSNDTSIAIVHWDGEINRDMQSWMTGLRLNPRAISTRTEELKDVDDTSRGSWDRQPAPPRE